MIDILMQTAAAEKTEYHCDTCHAKVGIVLVNYNGLKFMPACLETLKRVDYAEFEIIIVDNASSDGSAEWTEQNYRELNLIRLEQNTGVVGGNNAGMQWCIANGCDYVLLLNNDTEVEPDFLSKLMCHADQNTLLVPKIYFYDNREVLNSHFGHFDFWNGRNVEWFYDQPDTEKSSQLCVGTMSNTCAMLIPRAVLDKIGMMDENYFMYFDDNDFIHRAVFAGASLKFVPDSMIYHKESSSSGGQSLSPFTLYYLTRNRLYFMSKFQKNPVALAYFYSRFFMGRSVALAKFLVQGDRKLFKASCSAIVDFMARRTGAAPSGRYS